MCAEVNCRRSFESTEPETTRAQMRKATLMVHVKSILSIAAEAAWALDTSMLAGHSLPEPVTVNMVSLSAA
jgi:hypothetical protein